MIKEIPLEYTEFLDDIPWSEAWDILKDIILPHSATLIFNTILFILLGVFLSIIYIVILSKKQVFKRKPKYYNWGVKLYIPVLIITFLYAFGQWGVFRGIHKILVTKQPYIVSGIYNGTMGFCFKSEENKVETLEKIQSMAAEVKDGSMGLTMVLQEISNKLNTGYTLVDKTKNGMANYVIRKYGNDVYKSGLYAMLSLAGARAHINESISYNEFSVGMDFLMNVGHKDIELAILEKLNSWLDSLLTAQYQGIIKSLLTVLLIIMLIPVLEWFIYSTWIEKRTHNS